MEWGVQGRENCDETGEVVNFIRAFVVWATAVALVCCSRVFLGFHRLLTGLHFQGRLEGAAYALPSRLEVHDRAAVRSKCSTVTL
jgi:hypothetical protein